MTGSSFHVVVVKGGVRFFVRVQPRAKKNEIVGAYGEAIKVRVAAPPVGGAANKALVEFMAKKLGVRKGDVSIVRGQSGRRKVIEVQGMSGRQIKAKLVEQAE